MDFKKQIPLNAAVSFIFVFIMIVTGISWVVYSRWIHTDHRNGYEQRMDFLKNGLAKSTDDKDYRLEIAMSQYLNGQTKEAVKVFKQVLTNDPLNSKALLYLGLISADQKNFRDAELYLEKALNANQSMTGKILYYNLGLSCLENGEFEKAIKYLKYSVELDPASADANYLMGLAYFKSNKNDLAEPYLVKAFEINGYPKAALILKQMQKNHD